MARPRTATAILEARGAFIKHPERRPARAEEPKPNGQLGGPPENLDKDEKKVWAELASKLADGVAGNCDELAFEVLVCLVVNFRRRRKSHIPEVVGELAQMNKLFSQFGMTPADRSRVKAARGEQKKSPVSEFLGPVQ